MNDQHQPTVLYNGMINPVIPYAIRGAIWYQGESILGNPGVPMYPHVMETLVTEWRKRWAEGDFPFYAVQLAPLKNNSNNPRVREAQAEILSLKNTGLAVTVDIGDPADTCIRRTEPLCDRLGKVALANVYGSQGGVFRAGVCEDEGGGRCPVRISFTHAQGLTTHYPAGLYEHVSAPDAAGKGCGGDSRSERWAAEVVPDCGRGWQVCGCDGDDFDGSSVMVKSPDVSAPVSVRYAMGQLSLRREFVALTLRELPASSVPDQQDG